MRMKFVDESGVAKVQENQSGVKKDEGVARAISVSLNQISMTDGVETSASISPSSILPCRGRTFPGSRALQIVSTNSVVNRFSHFGSSAHCSQGCCHTGRRTHGI